MRENLSVRLRRLTGKSRPLLVIAAVAGIGISLAVATRAATPFVAIEPENGSLTAGATRVTDSTSSGGAAVKFGAGSAGGATSVPVPQGVSILNYGAIPNDAGDDAPAIRAALAANLNIYIPAGNYVLNSFCNNCVPTRHMDVIAMLRSNQTINADPNANLRFANGAINNSTSTWPFNLFAVASQSNVIISGGVWDFNGNNNLKRNGRDVTGYGVMTLASNNIVVQNLTMKDTPGQNYILQQDDGVGFKVLNSTFINGGTTLPLNREQVDYSTMYFTGFDVLVDNIKSLHTSAPWFYAGGIELHGSRQTVQNSYFEYGWPAFYIGPNSATGDCCDVQADVTIQNNTIAKSNRGLTMHRTQTETRIANVKILNNKWDIQRNPNSGEEFGIEQIADSTVNGFTATGNTFNNVDGGASFAINIGPTQNVNISNNTGAGWGGCGVASRGAWTNTIFTNNIGLTRC